jgi:hypothetical protein
MTHCTTRVPRCPSRFFGQSRTSALPHNTSSNISTSRSANEDFSSPQTPTAHASTLYVRSWGALALGIICAGVTGLVIFEDVLRNKAPITTDHVLTAAVIAITAAAGHMWWRRLWSSVFITGLGLLLIFGSGLVYLVVASGGRNAEVAANKRHAAHASNSERTDRLRKIAEAEYILASCPAGSPAKDYGERCGLRDAMAAECGSGKGKRCDGKSYSVSTYEAAIEGHRSALKSLPALEEDGALKATARAIVAFKVVDGIEREKTERAYFDRLEIALPYVKALLVEIATVVFLGVGIGHRATVAATVATPTATVARHGPAVPRSSQPKAQLSHPATVAPAVTPSATVTQLRPTATVAQSEALALQLLQRAGTVAQEDIVQLFGGNKSRASRWLGRLEQEGTVARWSEGRNKFVVLVGQEGAAIQRGAILAV